MDYLKAFLVGGLLCLIGQILIDKTKLTPARILVSYVVIGVFLGAVGVYQSLVDFAGAGATVPLTGFGNTLAKGVKVTGATVHFVNEVPDGGEIIYQKAVEIEPDDTPETLQRRVMEQAEWILLPRAIEKVAKEMLA